MTATPTAPTLGGTIDTLWTLREEKRQLAAQIKVLDEKIKEMDKIMFSIMDAQGTKKGASQRASISIGEAIQPTTVDWEAFMKFVAAGKRNDKGAYLHLVQKRVAVEAYREVLSLGIVVPGITPYNQRVLNLRSL